MTVQEAIYILDSFNLRNNADKYVLEALDLGIEALEKQIPMKINAMLGAVENVEYDCPYCGSTLDVNEFNGYYCHWCGQALDWSDNNDKF